jgi:hypothetical protein
LKNEQLEVRPSALRPAVSLHLTPVLPHPYWRGARKENAKFDRHFSLPSRPTKPSQSQARHFNHQHQAPRVIMLARRLTIDACRGGSRRACQQRGVHPSFSTHLSAAALLHGHDTFAAVAAAADGSAAEAAALFDAASAQLRGSTKNDARSGYEPLKLRRILNEVREIHCSIGAAVIQHSA